jgi:hypothetical protein
MIGWYGIEVRVDIITSDPKFVINDVSGWGSEPEERCGTGLCSFFQPHSPLGLERGENSQQPHPDTTHLIIHLPVDTLSSLLKLLSDFQTSHTLIPIMAEQLVS